MVSIDLKLGAGCTVKFLYITNWLGCICSLREVEFEIINHESRLILDIWELVRHLADNPNPQPTRLANPDYCGNGSIEIVEVRDDEFMLLTFDGYLRINNIITTDEWRHAHRAAKNILRASDIKRTLSSTWVGKVGLVLTIIAGLPIAATILAIPYVINEIAYRITQRIAVGV